MARGMRTGDALLVLLSGGASALMAVPAEGVTLDDKQATTMRLLQKGADIHSLNAVRKHLSATKGGQLAAAAPAACRTLAVSDVVGDDLSVIGSGPTVPDSSTFEEAYNVLDRFGGAAAYPEGVRRRLQRGIRAEIPETPKPGDPRLTRSDATVICGRHDAMNGARTEASKRGYAVVTVEEPLVGEARDAATTHVRLLGGYAANDARPVCIISTGETTVHVKGTGRGGRNQEFALAAARAMAKAGGPWAAASVGTDGVDGPTDAAGAIVDAGTIERARRADLIPETFLNNNDAYHFFAALGDLICPGPTGTNVGDLQIFLLV